MAGEIVTHIGENSPEEVAYKLLERVAFIENMEIAGLQGSRQATSRKWLLDTYAECLHAVKGYRQVS